MADLDDCDTPDALRNWLRRFADERGFRFARYVHTGHGAHPDNPAERAPVRFLSALGEDADPWRPGDPAASVIWDSFLPYAWTTWDNAALSEAERAWLNAERMNGVRAGLVVPVQDYVAGPAYISFSGLDSGEGGAIAAPIDERIIVSAVCFHSRAKEILPTHEAGAARLTDRERSCLLHAAAGASIHQTATSLGIATRTVELYFSRAVRKLGAVNKVNAVAIAIEAGFIRI